MQIRIAYLLSKMPTPREVFLSLEVKGLIRTGLEVKVFCLREPHPQHEMLIMEQSLADVPIYYFEYMFCWQMWRDVGYWLQRNPNILCHA